MVKFIIWFQQRFHSVYLVCEVDVFKHLRFFLTSSDYTISCYCRALLKSQFDAIHVGNDLNVLINYQTYHKVNNPFFLILHVCGVDVFKHPRFCDDFSHLVTRHFLATANLR